MPENDPGLSCWAKGLRFHIMKPGHEQVSLHKTQRGLTLFLAKSHFLFSSLPLADYISRKQSVCPASNNLYIPLGRNELVPETKIIPTW